MLLFLAAAGGAVSSSLPLLPPLLPPPLSHCPATSNRQGAGWCGGKQRTKVLLGLAALTPETILWVTRSNPPFRSCLSALKQKCWRFFSSFGFSKVRKMASSRRTSLHPHGEASQSEPNWQAILLCCSNAQTQNSLPAATVVWGLCNRLMFCSEAK